MPRKPKSELIDQEAPEATDAWFAKARPAKAVLPGLLGDAAAKEMLKPKRGRPPSAAPKEHENIRLLLQLQQVGAIAGEPLPGFLAAQSFRGRSELLEHLGCGDAPEGRRDGIRAGY